VLLGPSDTPLTDDHQPVRLARAVQAGQVVPHAVTGPHPHAEGRILSQKMLARPALVAVRRVPTKQQVHPRPVSDTGESDFPDVRFLQDRSPVRP